MYVPAVGPNGKQLRAYAEVGACRVVAWLALNRSLQVYGTVPGTTELKPACWIGGYVVLNNNQVLVAPQTDLQPAHPQTALKVELEVNKRWLATAGVAAPLVLKQVALYDGDYHIPLANAAVLPVQSSGGGTLWSRLLL